MKRTKEIGYELLRVVDMDGFMELWNRTDTETKDKIVNEIGELAVQLVNGVEQSESTCNLQNVNRRFVPENLVMKKGAHIMRVDVFEDFRKQPVCRIKCIDDLSCTQDLDGEWVEEIGEGCFYLDVEKIDLVISKLQEAKAFLNGA